MRLGRWECRVRKGTLADECYEKFNGYEKMAERTIGERHRHRYEVNNEYVPVLEKKGLVVSGRSVLENLVEIIELPRTVHPFFIGTQFHPEYKSRPLAPHPIFLSFVRACLTNASLVQ
jgi:CTP synthase